MKYAFIRISNLTTYQELSVVQTSDILQHFQFWNSIIE